MKTYQDLLQTPAASVGNFIASAINDFMSSQEYREAKAGEAYYNKHNLTIENYRKTLTTLSGNKIEDLFSANYRLKTLFFRRLVTQQVQYVLGNGLVLEDMSHKEALGRDFDFQLQKAAKRAMTGGRAFGFWNLDHLEIFGFADTENEPGFCPLYDEETAELAAGIRFWFKKVGKERILRATLYEPEGYTEYIKPAKEKELKPMGERTSYKLIIKKTDALGIMSIEGVNYAKLPIVPLYANDSQQSELVGMRESIDCYDFVKSGLANDIDDTSGFFWLLENTGGMDDVDLAQFIQRMKTVRAAVVEGDGGARVEAKTLDVPVEARRTMLEILRRDIYEDFQALDVQTLSAAAKTTQEIQAAYQAQDNKCADFEYLILDFVQKILELAGIDDNPTFIWNRIVNQQEQTSMILAAANYLPDDLIVKHLPFLTPEEAEQAIAQNDLQDFETFNAPAPEKEDPEE